LVSRSGLEPEFRVS